MSHSHSNNDHKAPTGAWTEPDVIEFGSIVKFTIGLTVVAALAHVAMLFTFSYLDNTLKAEAPPIVYPLAGDQDLRRPPEPRLQGGVKSDNGRLMLPEEQIEHNPGVREALKELRDGEDKALTSYAWVDRSAQMARLPIDEAMKLTLQRGLPSRAQAAAGSQDKAQEQSK
jgi:hypothetical protein